MGAGGARPRGASSHARVLNALALERPFYSRAPDAVGAVYDRPRSVRIENAKLFLRAP
jgi:hypothetical protein